ncbi:MAG: hypothetical protein QM763_00330 [Agriterribacter sp.]
MKTFLIALSLLTCANFIELEKRSLLDNKVEILMPKDFTAMSQENVLKKYPGANRPKLVLTDESTTVNLAFSVLENPADSSTIEAYRDAIKKSYKARFPTATWVSDGVTRINGKNVGYIKVIIEATDQKIFNYLFMTDSGGKLLLGTFNCLEKDMKSWLPVSEEIINSLKVK